MSGSMAKVVVGLVLIAVAFIIFPIVLTGTDTILAWTSDNFSISTFTGLETVVKIAPLLVFLGFLFSGGFLTFQGFRGEGGGKAGRGLH